MLSEKAIRAIIKAKSPEIQVSAATLALIDKIVGEYVEEFITNSLHEQAEMNGRLLKCGLPSKKRLNVTHLLNAQRRIARGE